MFRSIRWRLVASYVLLTVLTVSAVGLVSMEIMRRSMQRRELQDLRANAQAVAQQALPLVWPGRRDRGLEQLAHTASFLGSVRVRILDRQGDVLADSGAPNQSNQLVWVLPSQRQDIFPGAPDGRLNWMRLPGDGLLLVPGIDLPRLEDLPPGVTFTFVRRVYTPWGSRFEFESTTQQGNIALAEDQPRSINSVREPIGNAEAPMGFVELSAGPGYTQQALRVTRRALIFAGGGVTLLAAVVGVLISRRIAAPIHDLTETAGRMAGGDFTSRVQVKAEDEIGELGIQFNQMAERLEASFQQVAAERNTLRRFIVDASHELRTPITALKNFNALLQGAAGADPQTREEFLTESQAQIERLEWITSNLLNLSRIDAGLLDLDYADHDVGEVLQAAASPFKALAAEKDIDLKIKPPPLEVQLHCDRTWTEIALTNLIENAIKYTPPGGSIEVGGVAEGDVIRLWVQDEGIGIQPEDLHLIFERFYRGRNTSTSGSGLGLSMVKSVVEAQGGRVSVESIPSQGSRFDLKWDKQ